MPEFGFDVWGGPPSSQVYALTAEPSVHKILFAIRDVSRTPGEIAALTGEPEAAVREKLKALEGFGLMAATGDKWLSQIPLYVEKQMREAEQIFRRVVLPDLKARTQSAREWATDGRCPRTPTSGTRPFRPWSRKGC